MLIGITYQNRKNITSLAGPVNDVQAFNKLLLERGFEQDAIQILSDGIVGADHPTRKGILDAFDELAETLQKDDFVFLYFGGHGSYQPASKDTTETDGLDEIFLPIDVGRWQGKTGPVENAITDDEMSGLIAKLRNRGAFVWAVFDQCHAGSMTRGETTKYRYVDPTTLGVPSLPTQVNAQRATRGAAENTTILEPASDIATDAGDAVIFYATQPWEIEPEWDVSDGDRETQTFGLFSYRLLQILSAYPHASYRQIAQQMQRRYDASATSRPTPLFIGSGMEASVFGLKPGEIIRQWPIKQVDEGLAIGAGRLQQLSEGSILAGMKNPATKEVLGYLKVKKAGLFRSILTPVAYGGKAPLMPPRASYARLVHTNPTLTLRIAGPQYPKGQDAEDVRKVRKVMQRLKAQNNDTLLKWVGAEQEADVGLRLEDGKLWMLSNLSEGIVKKGPYRNHSIHLAASEEHLYLILSDNLRRIAKAINLLRLASQFNDSILTDKLHITASIQRRGSEVLHPFTADTLPRLHDGDLLTFTLQNYSKLPVDLTMLFMDSQYGIDVWYPKTGQINRIGPGDKVTKRIKVATNTLGRERLLFIAIRANKFTPLSSDFRFLAQDSLPKSRSERRENGLSKEQSQIQALFERAGFGETARSGQGVGLKDPVLGDGVSENALMAGYSWMVE